MQSLCPALPLFCGNTSPQKSHSEASCREQRSWSWLREAWGPGVKRRRLKFMSYGYSVNKTGVGGFLKILFLNGGVDAFLYFGGGWDLWL